MIDYHPVRSERRRRFDRVTAACDLCKRRKVKCDGEQPCQYCVSRDLAGTCAFTAPRTRAQIRSVGTTPNRPPVQPSIVPTPQTTQGRARNEGTNHQPRSRQSLDENGPSPSSSPTISRDDHYEDTAVPLEGHILQDAQGKVIFIGDCAPLSFLQTVRHLITSDPEADGLSVPAARDCIIENARPPTSAQPQDVSVNIHDVPLLVQRYFFATSGLVELFQRDGLVEELKSWAVGTASHTDDAATAVFFLVLAIGAQDDHETKADAWFQHARDILLKNMCSDVNVATVQGFALVAIYMLRGSQPNGAYLYFSLAARTAYAIGIHRTEVNASFGESIRTMRDNIWKSLRVIDMLISTNLGRPPSTSDVDCTIKYSVARMNTDITANILDASVQIFMIIERVVVEVYSRKRISLRIADFVSRQLKGWAANWLQPLTDVVGQTNRDTSAYIALVGACSTLCSYYYGIMLLTRPFLIYDIYDHMGASIRGDGTQGDHASKRKYADAALDAASSFVETLQAAIHTGALPHRSPLIVSWLFTTSLVLAVGTMGRSGSIFVETCESAIHCLEFFSGTDPHARQYSVIVRSLLEHMSARVKKRERQLRLQRKQTSAELFGLLASSARPTTDNPSDCRFQASSEPVSSYATAASATSTAPLDWTMYDADFFALPWPTEYDPCLQDFLQPGTHNSDGASIADIPLFPMFEQQTNHGFRS
ncbi:hypothetical protein BU23DRAFT_488280 [Bimuria novae-zelandiae CBS 107.79]|uniref:Zn(2)-C6 fungal-type domain-containing protein n=1 Tax=Bimuria novae-zelandiae CBS 107.79 TaxID=1447943 RepID=A0A6A5USC2_9PLEO|nr:hypothetical protein BU23DRAFT_488280 [Bimuria novae-zelandiae CBS 107.79]